ncbi:MAG: pilus assembly protein N-terminal domain-containing protein [Gammaproteobacteria bacterium]
MSLQWFSAKGWGMLALVLVFFTGGAYAEEDYDSTVNIIQGQTRLMPYPNVTRVSIGHPDIANAQATGPNEILLTGLKAGVTDLRIWVASGSQKRYLLKVTDNSWVQILEVANIVLADVEGVNAREENGVVFIEGRVLREQEYPDYRRPARQDGKGIEIRHCGFQCDDAEGQLAGHDHDGCPSGGGSSQ